MRVLGLTVTLVSAAALAAGCGASSSGGSGAGSGATGAKVPAFATNFTPPASGCGSFDAKPPADPDGVIAALPKAQQEALGGYADYQGSTVKVVKSRWAAWKPDGSGPYRVAVSWGQLVSDFQVQTVDQLKQRLKATKGVGQVEVRTTGSNLDIAQQLQQYNSLVQAKPDVILLETASPDSFGGPVQKAAAQGIPTVTLLSPVPVDGAVNIDSNNYLGAAETASYLTKVVGGKGSVLLVRALATASIDSQVATPWKRVVARCPQMKVAGEVFGAFSEAQAKSETLKWLGTHPQKLDALTAMPGESSGVLQAFKQVGRPVPPAAEIGLDKGFLGHWRANDASYDAASTSLTPVSAGRATAEVIGRMLAGEGVKLNTIVGETPLVTDANLGDWADKSWTLQTSGTVSGHPDDFLPSKDLDAFFTTTSEGQ
ncbi:MAG TPA: substrate-binding domain-containing protein [Baekduia sp.]|nr:substrate-binding domain-containing protein [Baekduia sp.]